MKQAHYKQAHGSQNSSIGISRMLFFKTSLERLEIWHSSKSPIELGETEVLHLDRQNMEYLKININNGAILDFVPGMVR